MQLTWTDLHVRPNIIPDFYRIRDEFQEPSPIQSIVHNVRQNDGLRNHDAAAKPQIVPFISTLLVIIKHRRILRYRTAITGCEIRDHVLKGLQ